MQHVFAILFFLGGIQLIPAAATAGDTAEVVYLGAINPFQKEVPLRDPVTKKAVDGVLMGRVYKARRDADFDFYRYVTFYNVTVRKERMYSLPVHHEECHDKAELPFASYTYSYSGTAKISAGVEISGIGISVEMTKSEAIGTTRNLYADKVVAIHTPYLTKEDWEGYTYLQTYSNATGAESVVLKDPGGRVPYWMQIFYPGIASKTYPMPFEAIDMAWAFLVDRKVLSKCP